MENTDPHLLSNLPTYSDDGAVNALVEAPKGSLLKLSYNTKLGAFTVSHATLTLPTGQSSRHRNRPTFFDLFDHTDRSMWLAEKSQTPSKGCGCNKIRRYFQASLKKTGAARP
jgi:hypothetical protein